MQLGVRHRATPSLEDEAVIGPLLRFLTQHHSGPQPPAAPPAAERSPRRWLMTYRQDIKFFDVMMTFSTRSDIFFLDNRASLLFIFGCRLEISYLHSFRPRSVTSYVISLPGFVDASVSLRECLS